MEMTCKNCESTNITKGVTFGLSGEVGSFGPKFKTGIFIGVESMYCDLCEDCGEIIRQYIKPKKKRKWLTK